MGRFADLVDKILLCHVVNVFKDWEDRLGTNDGVKHNPEDHFLCAHQVTLNCEKSVRDLMKPQQAPSPYEQTRGNMDLIQMLQHPGSFRD